MSARSTQAFLFVGLATVAAYLGCGAAPPEPAVAVASTDARALARAQRDARRAALDEQGDAPTAPQEEVAAPEPEPEPEPDTKPEEVVEEPEEEPEEVVEEPEEVVEKPPEKPDKDAVCGSICDRAVVCAREMFDDAPSDIGRDMLEPMIEKLSAQCREECQDELSEDELETAQSCLDESDCEAFMECVRQLQD